MSKLSFLFTFRMMFNMKRTDMLKMWHHSTLRAQLLLETFSKRGAHVHSTGRLMYARDCVPTGAGELLMGCLEREYNPDVKTLRFF